MLGHLEQYHDQRYEGNKSFSVTKTNLQSNFPSSPQCYLLIMDIGNHLTYYLSLLRGRSIHPFCSKVKRDPLQTECTDDRNSVALCNLIRHEYALPKEYQVSGCDEQVGQ